MRLIIIGAGGHGQVILDTARDIGYDDENILFLDDRFSLNGQVYTYCDKNYTISDSCENFRNYIGNDTEFYVAIGNNQKRLELINKLSLLGAKLAVLIHPKAYVAKSAKIDSGSAVLANAVVNSCSTIGKGCIINAGAIVDHGCKISDGCHINSGAVVMPENELEPLTKVDSGQILNKK